MNTNSIKASQSYNSFTNLPSEVLWISTLIRIVRIPDQHLQLDQQRLAQRGGDDSHRFMVL